MHPNPIFRKAERRRNIDFAQQISFGTLSVNGGKGPLMAHVPFQLSDDGQKIEAHLVRSNPIVRLLKTELPAVFSVMGPNGYISPDWYRVEDQVPTWNYVAVHLRGFLRLMPDEKLSCVLEGLSTAFETRLLPKPIWKMDKMGQEPLARMMRQIVPIEMDVSELDGTWKLGQNKSADARMGAAEGLEKSRIGVDCDKLAQLMKKPSA